MCQVCLIGYWTGGAFLSLSYFDGYYLIISLLVLTLVVVERELKAVAQKPGDAAAGERVATRVPASGRAVSAGGK
jgi:hypothetical protein